MSERTSPNYSSLPGDAAAAPEGEAPRGVPPWQASCLACLTLLFALMASCSVMSYVNGYSPIEFDSSPGWSFIDRLKCGESRITLIDDRNAQLKLNLAPDGLPCARTMMEYAEDDCDRIFVIGYEGGPLDELPPSGWNKRRLNILHFEECVVNIEVLERLLGHKGVSLIVFDHVEVESWPEISTMLERKFWGMAKPEIRIDTGWSRDSDELRAFREEWELD